MIRVTWYRYLWYDTLELVPKCSTCFPGVCTRRDLTGTCAQTLGSSREEACRSAWHCIGLLRKPAPPPPPACPMPCADGARKRLENYVVHNNVVPSCHWFLVASLRSALCLDALTCFTHDKLYIPYVRTKILPLTAVRSLKF